jgi:hypothetical protein
MLAGSIVVLLQLAAAVPPTESRLLRESQRAQARFEVVRRMHLPRDRYGGSGPCDVIVGRFCYWYDSTEATVVPEPPIITAARNELLSMLDTVSAQLTMNGWVVGQQVRYLGEAGRHADVARALDQCRAERWWCLALEGLGLHTASRFVEAESVFAITLSALPASQRCDWLDLRPILPRALAAVASRLSCQDRMQLAERVLGWGQPLWSLPGNDLRTEHFSRLTMAAILEGSAPTHSASWGKDSRELLIRYGWSTWYTRRDPPPGSYASPSVVGHDRVPGYAFVPPVAPLDSLPVLSPTAWRLRDRLAETRYSSRRIERLGEARHQLARFLRGDSLLLAVVSSVSDTGMRAASTVSTVVARSEHATFRSAPGDGWMSVSAPNHRLLVSIESLDTISKRAERDRYTIEPLRCTGGLCVSDVLLLKTSTRVTHLDSALATAYASDRISTGEPMAIYWEMQGNAASPASISVTVQPSRPGIARRLAARLRLTQLAAPTRLQWRAALAESPRGEGVVLRLPPTSRGPHRIRLAVESGGATLQTTRDVDLVP